MSRNNRNSRPNNHRQAIRQALDEVPTDLVHAPVPVRREEPVKPVVAKATAVKEERPRRGWFGRGRGKSETAKGQGVAPAAAPQHPHTFEIERRAQRLEELLTTARDDLTAANRELREAHERAAAAEGELATQRAAAAEWQDTATELNTHFDALRVSHDELQHERAALGTAFETERSGRQHWERVASEQMTALDELGAQLGVVNGDLRAERDSHEQTRARAEELEGQTAALRAEWEANAQQLSDALHREREEFHRTLEDERLTAERARAEQAFQHREQVEKFQDEASAAISALQQRVADKDAALAAVDVELAGARADVVRLNEDVEAARGEAVAATARAREADELRMKAEQRIEELGDELAYVRSEVMGTPGGRKKSKSLFGRKPSPVKAAEKQSRAAVSLNDVAAPTTDPDVEDIIERRLFGNA